jgi:hypothetical protein
VKRKATALSLIAIMALLLASTVAVTVKPASAAPTQTASLVGGILAGTGPGMSNPTGNTQQNYLFAVDTSGALWYRSIYSDGTWNSLGGVCTASPAAVSLYANYDRQDVFVRGSDGAVWWKSYQGSWSDWKYVGGQLASGTGPAVSGSGDRLDVYVEGTDGVLWQKVWTGSSWSSWHPLGGKLTASPTVSTDSVIQSVYVRGTDAAVWWKQWNGVSWSGWKSLGGQLAPNTGPAVNYYGYRVFVQGTDNRLWLKESDSSGGWSGWMTLAGAPPEALSAVSPASTNIVANMHTMICVATTSGNIWSSTDSLVNWASWGSMGSPP